MPSRVLSERWPAGVGIAIGALVALLAAWAVSPALSVAIVGAVLAGVGYLVFVDRRDGDGGSGVPASTAELDRLHGAELALAAAPDTEVAARELSKLAMVVLAAPAAVVIIEGIGDAIHMEAGDSAAHPADAPGSRTRDLWVDGESRGSITIAARPGRAYGEREDQILEAIADQASFVLRRLALVEGLRTQLIALTDAFESSSDGIFTVGPDLDIRSWNRAMERITGITSDAAIGQPCCSTFRPLSEDGKPLYGDDCPGRKGVPVAAVVQIPVDSEDVGADGESAVWLDCAFSPTSDNGYVAVVRNVTGRKQTEGVSADILATVSHELRTPLSSLKDSLAALTDRGDELDDEERRTAYEVMVREEQRLENLVQQLAQASPIEENETELVTERLDWAKTVQEQIEYVQREYPNREFEVIIADPLPPIIADSQLAGQVLTNLLSNAIKFSPEGSTVEVNVEYARERVFTTVTDEGPGIADDDRDRIFEKFTRGTHRSSSGAHGVGLGLYIVRRSVEAMGGMVWVDDGETGGSAFTFSLPAVPVKVKRGVRTRRW